VLLAVVEDFLGGRRTDPWKRVELLERRRAQLHRPRRGTGGCAAGGARRASPWDDDLLTVGERRREVHLREIGLGGRPARTGDGVRDPRALPEPVQARPAHGSDHVHHHPRGGKAGHARRGDRRWGERLRLCGRARVQDQAAQEQDRGERAGGGQQQAPPLEKEFRHGSSVPKQVSRVCDRFVPEVPRIRHEIDTRA
jgi:hypothetical protein